MASEQAAQSRRRASTAESRLRDTLERLRYELHPREQSEHLPPLVHSPPNDATVGSPGQSEIEARRRRVAAELASAVTVLGTASERRQYIDRERMATEALLQTDRDRERTALEQALVRARAGITSPSRAASPGRAHQEESLRLSVAHAHAMLGDMQAKVDLLEDRESKLNGSVKGLHDELQKQYAVSQNIEADLKVAVDRISEEVNVLNLLRARMDTKNGEIQRLAAALRNKESELKRVQSALMAKDIDLQAKEDEIKQVQASQLAKNDELKATQDALQVSRWSEERLASADRERAEDIARVQAERLDELHQILRRAVGQEAALRDVQADVEALHKRLAQLQATNGLFYPEQLSPWWPRPPAGPSSPWRAPRPISAGRFALGPGPSVHGNSTTWQWQDLGSSNISSKE